MFSGPNPYENITASDRRDLRRDTALDLERYEQELRDALAEKASVPLQLLDCLTLTEVEVFLGRANTLWRTDDMWREAA